MILNIILSKKNLIGEKNGKIRRRKLRYFAVLIFLRGGYLPAKKTCQIGIFLL